MSIDRVVISLPLDGEGQAVAGRGGCRGRKAVVLNIEPGTENRSEEKWVDRIAVRGAVKGEREF